MRVLKCKKGIPLSEWDGSENVLVQDDLYHMNACQIEAFNTVIKTLQTVEDFQWVDEHFDVLSNEEIAKEHYHGLLKGYDEYFSDNRFAEEKKELIDMGEENFMNNYPISCGDFVSRKRFWMACIEVGIVEHEWYEEEDCSAFEQGLKNILECFPYNEEPPRENDTSYQDVSRYLQKHGK